MTPELIELISGLPMHGIFLIAIYLLWKRLEKLTDRLIDLQQSVNFLTRDVAQKNLKDEELPF